VLVVEPDAAACVARALVAGRPERIGGDLRTAAEMLACGIASAPAVEILKRHDARPIVVSEPELADAFQTLREGGGPDTTISGAAGLAGLLHVARRADLRRAHQLTESSRALLIITEGPVVELT
jgi:diaminopropionate ammonia-lyase